MRLLNWEYGAKLSCPEEERVEIQPMGRGTTQACVSYSRCGEYAAQKLFEGGTNLKRVAR